MRKILFGITAFLAVALPAQSAPPAARPAGKPALWKVADDDTTIYLFGTIHVLPANIDWRTPPLDRALREADVLVVETLIGDDPARIMQVMAKLATSPGLPPLADRVAPEKRDGLAKLLAASGLPANALDKTETWAAAVTLISLTVQKMGFRDDLGVEAQLTGISRAANKRIIGLETVEQQLGFLDGLSEKAQRALLESALDDPRTAQSEIQDMLSAWLGGDVREIARTFDDETNESPELRETLIRKRNAAWTQWVARRLAEPGTVFMAVGAGHLAGADSVQTMLAARGLVAQRIE